MGSGQKIVHQKIRKRIRIGAYIFVPVILVGGATIVFQLMTGSGNFGSFDFNIGKLWSWATSSEEEPVVQKEIELSGIITPFRVEVESQIPDKEEKTSMFRVEPVRSNTLRDVVSSAVFERNSDPFKPIEVKNVEPAKTFNYLKSGRHIDLLKKEYLIPQDIKAQRSKVAVGASFAPGVSYRRLRYNDISSVARIENKTAYTYGQSKEYRNQHDKPIMNFYSGIDVYVHLNDKWSVQTGFYYSSFGEKLKVVRKNDPDQLTSNVSSGSAFVDKKSVFESPEMVSYEPNEELPFTNYYGLMEVPVLVSYKAHEVNELLSVNVQLGGSYGYLDHADMLLYNYETNTYFWIPSSDFPLLNKHFISAITGVELSQYISPEIEIFANPQFKYAITPTFKREYEIKQNQWATGMRLGMKVHL